MSVATLRVLLVDDEPLARARARRLLDEIGGAEVVGEAGSVDEAVPLAESLAPDVLLLDVQMPGDDGFGLLRRLARRPAVVFVTAFDHHAVRAFEENAVDYLLKPFRAERLARALQRVRHELERPEELARRLRELIARWPAPATEPPATAPLERLIVRVGSRQIIVRTGDVYWFGAEDKLVFAATETERHWLNFTLDELERRLDPRAFRAHPPGRHRQPGPCRRTSTGLRGHVAAAAHRSGAHGTARESLAGKDAQGAARGLGSG